MELGIVLLVIIAVVIGIVFGMYIEKTKNNKDETQGIIYACYYEPGSSPSLLLEYSVPIDDIASRKRVIFDVTVIR